MVAYSLDLRTRVLKDSDAGMASKLVAETYAVSRAWVDRLKQRRRDALFSPEVQPRPESDRAVLREAEDHPAGGALSGAGGALGHHRRLRAALCADRVRELFPPLRLFGSYALMKSALVACIG